MTLLRLLVVLLVVGVRCQAMVIVWENWTKTNVSVSCNLTGGGRLYANLPVGVSEAHYATNIDSANVFVEKVDFSGTTASFVDFSGYRAGYVWHSQYDRFVVFCGYNGTTLAAIAFISKVAMTTDTWFIVGFNAGLIIFGFGWVTRIVRGISHHGAEI